MKLSLRRWRSTPRRLTAVLAAAALAVACTLVALVGPASAAAGCRVTYTLRTQWNTGFTADISITNLGEPISSWTLTFTWPGNQQIQPPGWNGTFSQSGTNVTGVNAPWNGSIPTNGTVSGIGFNGSYSGSNPSPTQFSVNGTVCTGTTTTTAGTTTTTGATTTTAGTTTTTRATTTTTSGTTTTTGVTTTTAGTTTTTIGGGGTHVDNPFAGAKGYVNPDWSAKAAADGGSAIANVSTFVWLDRIATVTGGSGVTMTLKDHLDTALSQMGSGSTPVVIGIVIYDLPNRDCAALASNGELRISQNGLNLYEHSYIDPIVSTIASNPAYAKLRIVAVIEPDSLPNLVTNLSFADCAEANSSGAYVQGIQYAINHLHQFANVYQYVDIAHYAWLGWDSNFTPAVNLISNVIKGTTAGVNSIDGFISDTANYSPVQEPYMTANQQISGQPVRSAHFYQWNQFIDEQSYDLAMRQAFINAGFPSTIGMLIDTSRNGWGGPNRPTGPSSSTDLDTFVDATRIDRRPHSGGWCNQNGAGLGMRPTTNVPAGFDAYVWVKPPGESDGTSDPTAPRFDAMCDPNAQNRYDNSVKTNALPGAPQAGQWFSAEFHMLLQNAYPPLG